MLYGIGHVLSKNVFHETPKSSMEQIFKAGYMIKLDKTFEFHETKFHRVVWALVNTFWSSHDRYCRQVDKVDRSTR